MVGDKHQNVGGLRSSLKDLDDVPSQGWQFSDGSQWRDDLDITVEGDDTDLVVEVEDVLVGEHVHYPERVSLSSLGGTTGKRPSVLGVYQRTGRNHSGRPVWQSRVREDRFLFYNGQLVRSVGDQVIMVS